MTKYRKVCFFESAILFVLATLSVWLFSTYVFYRVPSESMAPTALIGDFIAVNRWAKEPKRTDVIVIRAPHDQDPDYLKRLFGLPGDRIKMIDGILHINGESVKLEKTETYSYYDQKRNPRQGINFYETLLNGTRYQILKVNADWRSGPANNAKEFLVPDEHYFLMGDNRDQSLDSRFDVIGAIHKNNLVGRADLVWFSTNVRSLFDITHWFSSDVLKDRFMKCISP